MGGMDGVSTFLCGLEAHLPLAVEQDTARWFFGRVARTQLKHALLNRQSSIRLWVKQQIASSKGLEQEGFCDGRSALRGHDGRSAWCGGEQGHERVLIGQVKSERARSREC